MKTIHNQATTYLVLGIALLSNISASAQSREDETSIPSIRVTGEATIMATPDQAQIGVGVVTQAQSSRAAAAENAQRADAVMAALRRTLGSKADIKTISYSLNPDYRYPREGGRPTITGYTASNIVQVKISDLSEVGRVIDTAMEAGANTIHRLQFTLKDKDAVVAQALRQAALEARSKADALASALGVKIIRLLSVAEQGPVAVPVMERMMAARAEAAAAPTPIEPGTIEVRATVALTAEIGPQ